MTGTENTHALIEHFIREMIIEPAASFHTGPRSGAHTPLIIQAARARNLSVVEVEEGHYFHAGERVIGGVRRMVPSLIGSLGLAASGSKEVAKGLFSASGVATPRWAAIPQGKYMDAAAFLQESTGPIVVKPADGRGGAGVTTGIVNVTGLKRAWATARAASRARLPIIVEDQAAGVDVRAYVVGGRVTAAVTRVQPYVVGDGRRTIAELVEAKQRLRATNGYLKRMPIQVDPLALRRRHRNLSTVPLEGEIVILNEAANMHLGGENLDLTDTLSDDLNDLAVRASKAIPQLGCGGIDMIVRSPTDAKGAVALEVNAAANISVHHLPAFGKSRDVAGEIVDEMLRLEQVKM